MIKEKQEEQGGEWKAMVLMYATQVVKELGSGLAGKIKSHIEDIVANMIKRIIVLCISFLGVVLIVLGVIHLVNDLMGSTWAGYFVLGGILIVISLSVSFLSDRPKS